jgi:hypothetical protein
MLPLHRQDAANGGPHYDGDKSRSQSAFSRRLILLAKRFSILRIYQKIPILALLAFLLFLTLYWFPRALRDAVELQKGTKLYQQLIKEKNLPADTIPVLIPCYSRPAYLKQVLDSLRKASNIEKVSR